MAVKYGDTVVVDNFGTITTDTDTATAAGNSGVSCIGHTTLSAHLDSGSGTWTWQFKGPDEVWRTIYGGSDGTTAQAFTAAHMTNIFFADDVLIRGNATSGSSPVWDYQIIGNQQNRGI